LSRGEKNWRKEGQSVPSPSFVTVIRRNIFFEEILALIKKGETGDRVSRPFCKLLADKHLKIRVGEKEGQSITSPSFDSDTFG